MNLRKLAQGQQCMIRLFGCNGDPATTVLAHYSLAGYKGMGMKGDDFAFIDMKADPVQSLDIAVFNFEIFDLQKHQILSSPR